MYRAQKQVSEIDELKTATNNLGSSMDSQQTILFPRFK